MLKHDLALPPCSRRLGHRFPTTRWMRPTPFGEQRLLEHRDRRALRRVERSGIVDDHARVDRSSDRGPWLWPRDERPQQSPVARPDLRHGRSDGPSRVPRPTSSWVVAGRTPFASARPEPPIAPVPLDAAKSWGRQPDSCSTRIGDGDETPPARRTFRGTDSTRPCPVDRRTDAAPVAGSAPITARRSTTLAWRQDLVQELASMRYRKKALQP